MTVPLTVRGVLIEYPTNGDLAWGNEATQFATLTASAVAPISGLYNTTTGHVGNLALDNSGNLTLNGITVGTGSVSGAVGQVLVSSGTGNAIPISYGTTGQVLTSAGAGFAPAYVNQSAIIAGNGIQTVASLPLTGDFVGQVVYYITDGLLYRWNGSAWVSTLPTAQLTGLIQTLQINDAAITAAKTSLAAIDSLTGLIAAGQVNTAQLVAGAVTNVKIANAAVQAAQLNVAAIDGVTGALANGSVSNANIVAGAVDSVSLASAAVTAAKTSIAAIDATSGNLTANSVTASNLTAGSVIAGKIATGAVTAATIAANAVVAGNISAGAVTAGALAANAVTAGTIAANAVTATTIAAGAVTTSALAAGSVTTSTIAAGAITTTTLAANSVTTANIQAANITAALMATDSITTNNIVAGNVTGVKIAAGTITASNIAAGTITATQIAAGSITGTTVAAGTLTASNIQAGTLTAATMATGTITAASGVIGSLDASVMTVGSLRGIDVQAGSFMTNGSFLTSSTAGGATTVFVGNTIDFPSSGTAVIVDPTNDRDYFTYTGTTSTSFTGCSGVLAHAANNVVIPQVKTILITGPGDELRFYNNAGGGYEELACIGLVNVVGDSCLVTGGTTTTGNTKVGVGGYSNSTYGVKGTSVSGIAIHGNTGSNHGIEGVSTGSGYGGVHGFNGGTLGIGVFGESSGSGQALYAKSNSTGAHIGTNPLAARPAGNLGDIAMCFTTGGGVGTRTGTPRPVYYDGSNWLFFSNDAIFSG